MDRTIKDQIDTINQRIKELNSLYHIAAIKSDISDGEISIWSVLLESDGEYSQQDLSDLLFLPKQITFLFSYISIGLSRTIGWCADG